MGINQDFHPPLSASQPRKSKARHLLLLVPLIVVAALVVFFNNATNSGLEARETPLCGACADAIRVAGRACEPASRT